MSKSESLKVIALISGGKDSLFSLLHCINHGHKVVALANLCPSKGQPNSSILRIEPKAEFEADEEQEDLDSFMYQTVGHSIISLYARALDIPLFRREICGSPIQTSQSYDARNSEADETEDLTALLSEIKKQLPGVKAVSSGGILSTYQRTRVESVALRLGLVPLSFLWQYPYLPPPPERPDSSTGLLDDMAAAGCDARIIKIASGGIKESMLWADVTQSATYTGLLAGMSRYVGGSEKALRATVLGEGGEYETMAINGPDLVWKSHIQIDTAENLTVSSEGGNSHLRLGRAKLVEHHTSARSGSDSIQSVRVPKLFDSRFEDLSRELSILGRTEKQESSQNATGDGKTLSPRLIQSEQGQQFAQAHPVNAYSRLDLVSSISVSRHAKLITVSNITSVELRGNLTRHLKTILHSLPIDYPDVVPKDISPDDIIFSTILLSSMSMFASVNAEYASLLKRPNPPARVTVAVEGDMLPFNTNGIALSVVLDIGKRRARKGLHVQSRSYWAPANIGPYSQAISVKLFPEEDETESSEEEVIFVAGQIPLVPSTMEMLDAVFTEQTLLALQHLWRIGQERGVDWWTGAVAFLPKHDEHDNILEKVKTCVRAWELLHDEIASSKAGPDEEDDDEDFDIWHAQHNARFGIVPAKVSVAQQDLVHTLPNFDVLAQHSRAQLSDSRVLLLLVAEVLELPRSAQVEWQSLGLGGLANTGQTQVNLGTVRYEWGHVSHCDVSRKSNRQAGMQSLALEEQDSEDEVRVVKFVSLAVFPVTDVDESSQRFRDIQETLRDMVLCRDGVQGQVNLSHGTVYISRGKMGQTVMEHLKLSEYLPGFAQIPCRRLWAGEKSELSLAINFRMDQGSLLRTVDETKLVVLT